MCAAVGSPLGGIDAMGYSPEETFMGKSSPVIRSIKKETNNSMFEDVNSGTAMDQIPPTTSQQLKRLATMKAARNANRNNAASMGGANAQNGDGSANFRMSSTAVGKVSYFKSICMYALLSGEELKHVTSYSHLYMLHLF